MDYEAITPKRVKSLEKKVKELESRALQAIGGLKNDPIPSKVDDITLPLEISNKSFMYNKEPVHPNEIVNKNYVDANTGSGGASALDDLSDVSYSSGDLTITSLDKIIADDFVVDSGASIELDSHNGNFVAKKAGTEFSVANSAYAGMILGYTRLTATAGTATFEIQNSMTVESDVHKITFKTPPSELVEIEMSALINVASTSTHIETSLSTQNTTDGYSALSQEYEYDGVGVFHSDGEADDEVINIKWVLDSADLAAIGSENTFWVAFSTNGETKTAFLQYGGRTSVGQGNHPFIIKATALPATIYEG